MLLKSSYNTGTYLIQEEKPQLPIDKNTCNHTLEIFSGDVIQFGQGNCYYTGYNKTNFHNIMIYEYIWKYYIVPSLDVYEGPRSDSNNNDNGRRDQTCVNKCIR